MLANIHIKNFIIVKSLSLDFQNGLHVLTGETGAGKSIWIDAIEIGLGGRVDARMIYPGETRSEITLCFDLAHHTHTKKWLSSQDLPSEDECIIRRIIDQDKPSRTTLNGIPIPQQLIRTLAHYLLCIYGQHQHQRLLKSDEQRELLDHYAGNDLLLETIQTQYTEWKKLECEIQICTEQAKNKSSDLALWQYQLEELQTLQLEDNEYEKLFSRYQQLHRKKQFAITLHETLSFIQGDDQPAACALAQQALQKLNTIRAEDAEISNIQQLLTTANIHLEEAFDALQKYCHHIDMDDNQLQKIEKRLTILQDVARKHHIDPAQLNELIISLQQKITQSEKADEIILAHKQKQKTIIAEYDASAKKLSQSRKKAAEKLSAAITAQMQTLGMSGGYVEISLEKNENPISAFGNEQIYFLITTNPGQKPHALSHIVSGGELSRLSLIIQMLTAEKKNTPTLIFDEVDVGIGGKTAEIVGKLLRELSNNTQVLCVTHLPQVAANGHHHFKAEKVSDGKITSTMIKLLDKKEQTEEIARMLSGAKITSNSLSHAKELLALMS